MKIYNSKKISEKTKNKLFNRPAIDVNSVEKIVKPILNDIKKNGEEAVINYARKFDGLIDTDIKLNKKEILNAGNMVSSELKYAIQQAVKNIENFHLLQKPIDYTIETLPGIKCSRIFKSIENVGLYIPGGSAVLVSTLLMLAIPARIAGCKRIVVCSPAKNGIIHPAVIYAASIMNITEFYKVGGAHAVGMMAYGTKKIKKVDKIFGPGNQYVTAAKTLVSIDPGGASIDMPAGPSEVLIIADKYANASFVASDLLSQAEHGADSQVILLTTDISFSEKVLTELKLQLKLLPRKKIAENALKSSFIMKVNSINEALEISNSYAPEHLILNIKEPNKYVSKIVNAGSVFVGPYSPESAGDYASGTNHSLPTYGYAKSFGGVNVESFMKPITFQTLSKNGLKEISNSVITLAETEGLQAHANAVKIRFAK